MEWNSKTRNAFSALILIVIIVIYTFYRNSTEETSVTVGIDDVKIGIVLNSEEPVFIQLDEVQDVELVKNCGIEVYMNDADAGGGMEGTGSMGVGDNEEGTESEDRAGGTEYRIYADEDMDTFVVITTMDAVYIVNTSTANATENVYKDIVGAIAD